MGIRVYQNIVPPPLTTHQYRYTAKGKTARRTYKTPAVLLAGEGALCLQVARIQTTHLNDLHLLVR
ncbi:hypothetical protein [Niallia oryzisoli]|uniref:hypothetical protein n=1 Tax=Niallia oryzisoli TaxID=1737571 RepID=UPI0037362464